MKGVVSLIFTISLLIWISGCSVKTVETLDRTIVVNHTNPEINLKPGEVFVAHLNEGIPVGSAVVTSPKMTFLESSMFSIEGEIIGDVGGYCINPTDGASSYGFSSYCSNEEAIGQTIEVKIENIESIWVWESKHKYGRYKPSSTFGGALVGVLGELLGLAILVIVAGLIW